MAKVSVVITVKDEKAPSLTNQTLKPDEIIVIDAKDHKNCNRSVGRNIGVKKAKGDIIAFTDAGCVPEANWLAELIKPFKDKDVQVVSGYYKGLPETIFQKCLVPYVLVMPEQIGNEFLPSTRSMAMRKGVGLFDETLWHNEDYAFAKNLKNKGIKFAFAKSAVVGWIPRKNLKEAAWMFLRFAVGDAQSGLLRPKVKLLFLRYYLFFFLVFLNYWFALFLIPYLIWAISKNYRYVQDWRAIYWLPILQITADIAVIFGTIMGLLSKTK